MIKRMLSQVFYICCIFLCFVSMTMTMPSIFLGVTLKNPLIAFGLIVLGIFVTPQAIVQGRLSDKFVLPRDYVKLFCYGIVCWIFIAIFTVGLYAVAVKKF